MVSVARKNAKESTKTAKAMQREIREKKKTARAEIKQNREEEKTRKLGVQQDVLNYAQQKGLTSKIIFVGNKKRRYGEQFPRWYGLENYGFIWHNEWADPEIIDSRTGRILNCTIVEDSMWSLFCEDYPVESNSADYDNYFAKFVRQNDYWVDEFFDSAWTPNGRWCGKMTLDGRRLY